jgi:excisionase family DNA binding protein
MEKNEYLSIAQVAKILRISRVAVYKKVKKGIIPAMKVGKFYAIPRENVIKRVRRIKGHVLTNEEKDKIKMAVMKTVNDYGEVLKRLGAE